MRVACAIVLSLALLAACDRQPARPAATKPAESNPSPIEPGRIAVPESVRSNLGITFAKVEARRVASTIRLPGRFEPLPSARRQYVTPLPGKIELLVRQYQRLEAGAPVYRIVSPDWMKLRQQLADDLAAVSKAEAGVGVARAALAEAQTTADLLARRIAALAEAEVRRAELETALAEKRAALPRFEAELRAAVADHDAARQKFPLTLATAASIVGISAADLAAEVESPSGKLPRWRTIDAIEVNAAAPGVVELLEVTNGSWVEAHKPVLTMIDPASLRFRAVALQADLARLRDGLPANVVSLRGTTTQNAAAMTGKLAIGLEASPEQRTVEVLVDLDPAAPPPPWAKAGVSALAEVVLDQTEGPQPAIPLAAVVQDELKRIYFRRDPKKPDQVIRVEGDFGLSDGQWIIVKSGVKAGDEVVLDGVYELKLASAAATGPAGKRGHFHADGTFHEEHN